jgi:hypothetical protein
MPVQKGKDGNRCIAIASNRTFPPAGPLTIDSQVILP